MTKIHISCPKIYCTCYTSVYQQIFTSSCWSFAHNTALTETLGQAPSRSWWNIDTFCSTISSLPYSFSFLLHWPSSIAFQPVSLTSMFAKSIREHLVWHSHHTALGIPVLGCHSLGIDQIQRLPCNRYWCQLDYPSHYSSLPNHCYAKCFQVHYPHHFRLDDGWLFWISRHWIFEFDLQGGPLQTKLRAKVIFLAVNMQLHHHVERVTRMFWWSLLHPKFILRPWCTLFEREFPSV